MRYLAHAVLHAGQVYRHAVVELADGRLTIDRFEREIHSTAFVSGFIIVAAAGKVKANQRRALTAIVRRDDLIEMALKRVMRYASAHSIYAGPADTPELLILSR